MEIGRLFRISSKSHLAGIILLFSFLTALGLWLAAEFDYERTEDRARILLQKTAASLDERMKRTIVATELILKFATERIQEIGIERTASSRREWERLRSYAAALPDVGSLWLLDAKADLLMDSTRYPSQPMNFADREYFTPQREKGIENYIGPVVKGRITQKFSFTISRRIADRDGKFSGILVAAIETDDFTNFLRNIAIGENGAVAVWRTDGKLILRQPMEDEYLNKDFSYLKVFQVPLQESPSGFFFSDKTVDGIGRLVAYQKMKDLPLLVVTSIPSASIKQMWYANVKNHTLIAFLGLCGLVGLSWLVYRSVVKEDSARRELESAHDELVKLNAELEQRVLDRTSQLVSANKDLSNEINERRRAEEELRESERRFRALAEALPQIVWTAGAEGGVEWFNQRWYEYTGEPPAVGEGWGWEKVSHPDDIARTLQNWQEAREKGSLFQNEIRIRRHDGQYRWFLVRAWPMRDAGQNAGRWFGTNTDIHELKAAEAALRQSQIDSDRAQEVGEIGSWRMDIRRNVLVWSDENHRIFGVPKGTALTYETFLGIVHPEDRRYVDPKWQAGLRGEPYDIEHRILVGRQVKWVREKAYLEHDKQGNLLGGFGITQNITERKEGEQALQDSEARFRLLSETAGRLLATDNPQGIVNELCRAVMAHLDCQVFLNFLVDEDAGWLRLNACAGIPEEEARKIERLEYGAAVCGCVDRDGTPVVAENIFNFPDPRTELVKSYGVQAYACHPLKVEGRLIGTLSFGTKTKVSFSPEDLALMRTVADQVSTAMERVRLIQELQRSRDELESRVQERTEELTRSHQRLQQLASQLLQAQEKERKRVAVELHDGLLSELAAMKFLFEAKLMLLKKGQLGDAKEFDRVTEIMQKAIKETRGIMNNLRPSILDELGLVPTIGWLLQEYQKAYGHIGFQKEIEVLEKDIPEILKVVIFRVLQEALNNFAKHGKGNSVSLSLWKSGNSLHLRIKDNGQKFDIGKVQKGLGLESMRERVEISGGVFQVESSIGQGTTILATWIYS